MLALALLPLGKAAVAETGADPAPRQVSTPVAADLVPRTVAPTQEASVRPVAVKAAATPDLPSGQVSVQVAATPATAQPSAPAPSATPASTPAASTPPKPAANEPAPTKKVPYKPTPHKPTRPGASTPPPGNPTPGTSHGSRRNASNTGVPAGTVLRPSGSLTITKDGTVIEALDITGTVIVDADDVIIRKSRIRNTGAIPVRVKDAENLLIEDVEIDGQGKGVPAVAYNDYTLRRVNIHHVGEGPRIAGGDVVIEDSYIHHLVQVGDNHTDAVQAVGGSNILLRNNNLQSYNPDTGKLGNAAFMFGEDDNPLRNCVVVGNYLNGGNYTVNGGGSGTTGAQCSFSDNEFGRDLRYGTHGNLGPNVRWDLTNRWRDTGMPV